MSERRKEIPKNLVHVLLMQVLELYNTLVTTYFDYLPTMQRNEMEPNEGLETIK